MAALVGSLGERRVSALEAFVRDLETQWGREQVVLGGVAFVGIATVP
jgi:hypothetical protein